MVMHELLNKIANYYIEKYFKWLINSEFQENTIAVFELLECRQKMLYTRSTPYTIINTIINPSSLIGILVHEGLDTILKHINKSSIFSKKVIIDNAEYTINGWPDYYDGEKIIEFKVSTIPIKEPDSRHVMQVRLYMWLTNCREGYLTYITPRKILTYRIENPATDDEVKELLKNWPSPRDSNECMQCMFRNVCTYAVEKKREEVEKQQST